MSETPDMLPRVLITPAIHSNRFFITLTATGARLTFFEKINDELSPPRVALQMSLEDLDALVGLIQRLRKPKGI